MPSTQPVLHFGKVYVNSGQSAAAGGYCRNLTCFRLLSLTPLNGRSPQGVPAMCTKVSSTTPRFASNACGFTPWRDQRMSRVYVTEAISFTRSHLMKPIGFLPGGRSVETFGAPKHCSLPGCDSRSFPMRFGLDVRWRAVGVHQYAPVCRSTRSRGLPPHYLGLRN